MPQTVAKQKIPTASVTQSLVWECPDCGKLAIGPNWLVEGDKVQCRCGCVARVGTMYAECRPEPFDEHHTFAAK